MTEEIPKTVWTYLGGFKRGIGLLSFVLLVLNGVGAIPLSAELATMITAIVMSAIGGNTVAGIKSAK